MTVPELLADLAGRLKARRLAMGWPQAETARRAGIPLRTWQRLENQGQASIADLVKAAVALRCEDGLAQLFPEPPAANLDELLQRQARSDATRAPRRRAPRRRSP